jgi:hypothetical protein
MDNPGLARLLHFKKYIPLDIPSPSNADGNRCSFLIYERHPTPYPSLDRTDLSSFAMAGADPKKLNSSSATTTGIDSQLPPPEKLPPSLQKIIDKADKEDNFYDELWEGT